MARPKKTEKGHEIANTKYKQTMIAKLGSEEALREYYRNIGSKGGKNGHTGGFASNPALARVAGKKGGRISRSKSEFLGESNGYRRYKSKTTGKIYEVKI